MARAEADVKCVQLTQFLNPTYWAWTDYDKSYLGNLQAMVEIMYLKLTNSGLILDDMHGIIHDNDVSSDWNEQLSTEVIVPKDPHIHCLMRFKNGVSITSLANILGVEPQYIEKAKRGKYAFDNMMAYLTHVKYDDKYQYRPEDVYTKVGESYLKVYNNRYVAWLKGKAKLKSDKAKVDIDYLIELITTGQVTKNEVLLTDEYYTIYARNGRRCNEAFTYYGELRMAKTMQAMQNGEFRTAVIYITGRAGEGKSKYANTIIDEFIDKSRTKYGEQWRVCRTASTNPLDEYEGEEILFMDDVRGGTLTASDWLKLLDPENITPGSARYKNKTPACRCIIITSTKDMVEFFYNTKQMEGNNTEVLDQFFRRIMTHAIVYKLPNSEERRVRIHRPQEVERYTAAVPNSNGVMVSLTQGFVPQFQNDLTIDDSVKYLSNLVIDENNLLPQGNTI